MSGLSGARTIAATDFRDTTTAQEEALGTYQETVDGRGYRYIRAGGSDLAPGKICVAATIDTNVVNVTVAATAAAGAEELTIDAGGAIVADAYKEGYVAISDATGEGIAYQVRTHNVLSGAGELVLKLSEPLKVGVTVDVSEATLIKNPWADVVISVADQGDMAVGVPNITIGDTEFGWVQTHGVCAVWADETIAVGSAITTGSSTVGAIETKDVDDAFPEYGYALVAGVDTEYRPVYLTID